VFGGLLLWLVGLTQWLPPSKRPVEPIAGGRRLQHRGTKPGG